MRTYWTAHALAARGHDVHVVTNAKEVAAPFRMHMRAEDWTRCESQGLAGSVKVHWTEPVDRSQSYIPMASPFVSKLAGIAGQVHSEHPFDVIFSHYMEPYGIAGYLAAQMTGVPHVVRMAGSDAGRLWHHPQLEALYDHVLRSAHIVVAVGAVMDRALQHGVDPERIASGGGYVPPEDFFTPKGAAIDFTMLRKEIEQNPDLSDMQWGGFEADKPHFGICGKLGDSKGSFALLAALHQLKLEGLDFGLVALAHGRPDIESRFRQRVCELGLRNHVLQIPFLPHWRVPEFLRGCLAVCCLEQDFPIGFHSPIIPLEVLLCGSCLVASTEVIRKLPQWDRLPHGYGCVAVNDVNDIKELSGKLAAIACRPHYAADVGARGRAFALDCQQNIEFPDRLERILKIAAERRTLPSAASTAMAAGTEEAEDRFRLTQIACLALGDTSQGPCLGAEQVSKSGLEYPKQVLAKLQAAIGLGSTKFQPFAQAVETEIAIAQAEADDESLFDTSIDPIFRMDIAEWALDIRALGGLVPVRECRSSILRFEHDISELLRIQTIADFPERLGLGPSHVLVCRGNTSRGPQLIDRFTARILELSDGTRTCDEIAAQLDREFGRREPLNHLAWMENLFLSGLIGLTDSRAGAHRQIV